MINPSRYSWELNRLQFREARTGRYVPHQHVFRQINRVIDVSQRRMVKLADQVRERVITINAFKSAMATEIKSLHIATAMAANGGFTQMTPARWGAVGGNLKREYGYLNRFGAEIGSNALPRDSGRIRSRARAYTANARLVFWNTVNDRMAESEMNVEAARKLGPVATEHCAGCQSVAGEWMKLDKLPAIGTMECITTPQSRVLTSQGWIPISQIEIGMFVFTHRRRWRRVLATPVSSPRLDHQFATLIGPTGREIGFTTDHRLWTPTGWQSVEQIVTNDLSMYYHVDHEMPQMQETDPRRLRETGLPTMSENLYLRSAQRPQSDSLQELRSKSERESAMGRSQETRLEASRFAASKETTTDPLLGSEQQNALAATAERWPILCLVLGRERPASDDLSGPVGLDQSSRADPAWQNCSPQGRDPLARHPGKPGIEDPCDSHTRSPLRARPKRQRNSQVDLCKSTVPTLVYPKDKGAPETTTILSSELLESRAAIQHSRTTQATVPTCLYDLTIDEDESFIVEGLIAHNCRWFCQCSVIYRSRLGPRLNGHKAGIFADELLSATRAEPLLATELSRRERELLETIRFGFGHIEKAQLGSAEFRVARKLVEKGELIRERVEGRLIYYLKASDTEPVFQAAPVTRFLNRAAKLPRGERQVFELIASSPHPLKPTDLSRSQLRFATSLIKRGEIQQQNGVGQFLLTVIPTRL